MNNSPTALTAIQSDIDRTIAAGPFAASWGSLENYRIPQWYKDAKFGIFIHWGPYSVPAFDDEWYPHRMYLKEASEHSHGVYEHHLKTYGPHREFGYKDFIPMLKAERFDAAQWVDLFVRAGAKFVMPVAEHHDGFPMYDCSLTRWNAVKMGPKRDVLRELAAAVRERGMVFSASSHRAEHWWFFNAGRGFDSDVNDPAYADFYGPAMPKQMQPDQNFLEDWLARTCEMVRKYEPHIVWFDWWIEEPAFEPYLKKFAAYYYNWAAAKGVEVAINYKLQAYPVETAVFDIERGQVSGIRPLFWQNDTSVSKNSWSYRANHDYKEVAGIVQDLMDIVSKNGALLLNIGPKSDGTIPEPEQKMLLEIGDWLAINGEAVYGTRPWKLFGEGPTKIDEGRFTDMKRTAFTSEDIRFTAREDVIYASVLVWPADGTVRIRSLGSSKPQPPAQIARVELLGASGELRFTRDGDALTIQMPPQLPKSLGVACLRITRA
jgi:alpha-L-fucosidase